MMRTSQNITLVVVASIDLLKKNKQPDSLREWPPDLTSCFHQNILGFGGNPKSISISKYLHYCPNTCEVASLKWSGSENRRSTTSSEDKWHVRGKQCVRKRQKQVLHLISRQQADRNILPVARRSDRSSFCKRCFMFLCDNKIQFYSQRIQIEKNRRNRREWGWRQEGPTLRNIHFLVPSLSLPCNFEDCLAVIALPPSRFHTKKRIKSYFSFCCCASTCVFRR